jgi:hypothetical protein
MNIILPFYSCVNSKSAFDRSIFFGYLQAMSEQRTGGKVGRPATGAGHVAEAHLYLRAEDRDLLVALKRRLGLGTTGVFRLALRRLAEQEGME